MSTQTLPPPPASAPETTPDPVTTAEHDEVGQRPPAPRVSGVRLILYSCLGVAAIAGLYAAGWLPRTHQAAALEHAVNEAKARLPRVIAIVPKQSPETVVAVVPGDVRAMEDTAIYARTTGYIRKWHVDIGDEVQADQLLAEIDAPELEKELRQAEAALKPLRARLETAEATLKLAEITKRRTLALPNGAITEQERDEARIKADTAATVVTAAAADISVGEANVNRIHELHAFTKIHAPFPGTITSRDIDVGQLVTPGNADGQALFRLARTNPVRVLVNVPQIYATGVETDMSAQVIVRELPGRKVMGKVTRTAGAIDPATRTLRTEIEVPNEDGALLVGSYVQVKLEVRRASPPLLIPASSLTFNADGMRVATLDAENRVHFQSVVVEGDFGTEVGISEGLTPSDRVVTNPGDRLSEGIKVEVADPS
jgi:RND family efflux transporter MFP subunit